MGRGVQSGEGITSYKWGDYDTYSALCEIIDNAIQANAENVHIIVADKKVETASGRIVKRISDVIIYDDGSTLNERRDKTAHRACSWCLWVVCHFSFFSYTR